MTVTGQGETAAFLTLDDVVVVGRNLVGRIGGIDDQGAVESHAQDAAGLQLGVNFEGGEK